MDITVVIADPPAASIFIATWFDERGSHRAIMHPPPPEPVTFAPCAPPLRAAWVSVSRFEGEMGQSPETLRLFFM